MKKTIATATATAIVTAVITIACFAGCAKKETTKSTATAYLHQDETVSVATVDLSDGYSVEFTRGAIYLYDKEVEENTEAVAIGIVLEQEAYDNYLKAAQASANKKEISGGIIYESDSGLMFVRTANDSVNFCLFAENATQALLEKYAARFELAPEI